MKILEGKRGLIFGALDEKSIAWKVAQNAHEQGAKFVLSNAPIALRMGKINELAEKTGSRVIPADATSVDDLNKLFEESVKLLGCLLYTSPSPRDGSISRMPSSA